MSKNFPEIILVTRETPANSDSYLAVREGTYSDVEETTTVARYQLMEVGKIVVERHYDPQQKRGSRNPRGNREH